MSTQRLGAWAYRRIGALEAWAHLDRDHACVLSITSALHAEPKTDVVRLANRDHITGEVKRLERGRLTFSTDDGGTIYFEWDNVAHVESVNQFEVATTDDRRFFGSLGPAPDGFLAVVGPAGIGSLAMTEVTAITPMGTSFWSKLDGSFDAGFSYTRSSGVGQLNLNSETVFRKTPIHRPADCLGHCDKTARRRT